MQQHPNADDFSEDLRDERSRSVDSLPWGPSSSGTLRGAPDRVRAVPREHLSFLHLFARNLVSAVVLGLFPAAVLSVVIPGVGQIYNGDFLRGIFWLIVTPGMWIGTGGFFGWVCHVIAAYTAEVKGRAAA